jgi:hypothetical protein
MTADETVRQILIRQSSAAVDGVLADGAAERAADWAAD